MTAEILAVGNHLEVHVVEEGGDAGMDQGKARKREAVLDGEAPAGGWPLLLDSRGS